MKNAIANKKFFKRFVSLLLSLLLVVGTLPMAAFAAEGSSDAVFVMNLSDYSVQDVCFGTLAEALDYINRMDSDSQWGVKLLNESVDAVENITMKEEVGFYPYKKNNSSYIVDPNSRISVRANGEVNLLEGSIYVATDTDKNSKLIVNGEVISTEFKPVMCYVDAKGHAITAGDYSDLNAAIEKHSKECLYDVVVRNLSNSSIASVYFETLAGAIDYINRNANGSQWNIRMLGNSMDAIENVTIKEDVSLTRCNKIASSFAIVPGARVSVAANGDVNLLEGAIYVANDTDENSKLIVNGEVISTEFKPVMCYVDAHGHTIAAADYTDLTAAIKQHTEECMKTVVVRNLTDSTIAPVYFETIAGAIDYINKNADGSQWNIRMLGDSMDAVENVIIKEDVSLSRYNMATSSYVIVPGARVSIAANGDVNLLEGSIYVANDTDENSKLIAKGEVVSTELKPVMCNVDAHGHVITAADYTDLTAAIERHTKECMKSVVVRNLTDSSIEPVYFETLADAIAHINRSANGSQWSIRMLGDSMDAVENVTIKEDVSLSRYNMVTSSYVIVSGARVSIAANGDVNLLEGIIYVTSQEDGVSKLVINGQVVDTDLNPVLGYVDANGHIITAADLTELNAEIEKYLAEAGGDTPSGETGGDTPSGETGGDTPSGETGGDTPSGETGGDTPAGETGEETSGGDESGESSGEIIDETKFNADVIKLFNTKAVFLNGYNNGQSIKPNNQMTRAEAAQMFYNMLNDKNIKTTAHFIDVPVNAWYADAVNTLATLGIMNGTAKDKFEPNRNINRAEFTTLVMRFANTVSTDECSFGDVQKGKWYYDAIAAVEQLGWIDGYDNKATFRPMNPITRAEVATIVNRMFDRNTEKDYVESNYAAPKFDDITAKHWAYYQIIVATSEAAA